MRYRTIIPLALALLVPAAGANAGQLAGDATDPPGSAQARAWGVWMQVPGQEIVVMAAATTSAGATSVASAAPVSFGGTAPVRATADEEASEESDAFQTYADPTGSMTFDAGLAEARVNPSTTYARATLGAGNGSGFAVADTLLTWEQQEQLLGAWTEVNDAVFGALNDVLGTVAPALEPTGLSLPYLEQVQAFAFVDVAGVQQATATGETVNAPGFASARSDVAIDRVSLLAGFVQIEGLSAVALAEDLDGTLASRTGATMQRLRIAGIEVDVDDAGLHAASNTPIPQDVLQDSLDQALAALADAGIVLRVAQTRQVDGVQQSTALELELLTPDGAVTVSVGHAEASATAVAAGDGLPVPAASQPAAATGVTLPAAAQPSQPWVHDRPAPPTVPAGPPAAATSSPNGPQSGAPRSGSSAAETAVTGAPAAAVAASTALRLRPLAADVARGMGPAYLLLLTGIIGAAAMVPALLRRTVRH